MNLKESIRRILREEVTKDENLYGEKLKPCSTKPMTGFYRDGYCRTGDDDTGSHTVCAKVTEEFLEFTNSMGNNLDMLEPLYRDWETDRKSTRLNSSHRL